MPELNQLTCSIELGRTNQKLREYLTNYGNGRVACLICAPEEDVRFSVHLTSTGYIAPGLACFVYIDGQYQCNRNKIDLREEENSSTGKGIQIDFRVRQKEEPQSDGSYFVGRDWSFGALNLGQSHSIYSLSMILFTDWIHSACKRTHKSAA